jgi:hypothetical protein
MADGRTFGVEASLRMTSNHGKNNKQKNTPWPESASELYRPSDRSKTIVKEIITTKAAGSSIGFYL